MMKCHNCRLSNSRLQSYSTIWQSLSWSKNSLSFKKLCISLPYSKQATTGPYPAQNESCTHPHSLFLQSILILPKPQVKVLVVSSLQISRLNFCEYFSNLSCLGADHLISHDFITLIIFGEEHKLITFLLRIMQYLHISAIFSVLKSRHTPDCDDFMTWCLTF